MPCTIPLDVPEGLLARTLALTALRLALPEAVVRVEGSEVWVSAECASVARGLATLWEERVAGVCGKGECIDRLRFASELATVLRVSRVSGIDADFVEKLFAGRARGSRIECVAAPQSITLMRAEFREYVRVPGGGGGLARDAVKPCDLAQVLAVIGYCVTLAYVDRQGAHLLIPPFREAPLGNPSLAYTYYKTLKNLYSVWARVSNRVSPAPLRLLLTAYAALAEPRLAWRPEPVVAVFKFKARGVDLAKAEHLPFTGLELLSRLVEEEGAAWAAEALVEGVAALTAAARRGGEAATLGEVADEYSRHILLFLEARDPDYALAAVRSLKPLLSPTGSLSAARVAVRGDGATLEEFVEELACGGDRGSSTTARVPRVAERLAAVARRLMSLAVEAGR